MSEIVTDAEKKLVKMLKEVEPEKDFIIAASLIARAENKTEELISFLEEYPGADTEDVMYFLVPGEEDEEQVA